MMAWLLLLAWGTSLLGAGAESAFPGPVLNAIRQVRVEGDQIENFPTQGRELLGAFKDQMQAWAIGRLGDPAMVSLSDTERASGLQKDMEAELREIGEPPPEVDPSVKDYKRFSGEVTARVVAPEGHRGLLLLEASVGFHCGEDLLVLLLFRRKDQSWGAWSAFPDVPRRVQEGSWGLKTLVGPPDREGRFILVMGHIVPWFQSNWRELSLDSVDLHRGESDLWLEASHRTVHGIYIAREPPFDLVLEGARGFTARFEDRSMDPGQSFHLRTMHFRLGEGDLSRLPPYGDTPADFLEEWVRLPWAVARSLVVKRLRPRMKMLWQGGNSGQAWGTFSPPATGGFSRKIPGGWQVDFEGWGPDGEGLPLSFLLQRRSNGYAIVGLTHPIPLKLQQGRRRRF